VISVLEINKMKKNYIKIFIIILIIAGLKIFFYLNRSITIRIKGDDCYYFQKYWWGSLYSQYEECSDGTNIETIYFRNGDIKSRKEF